MEVMAVGAYQTACEASPNRLQIDKWLTEGKSAIWISRELRKMNDPISDKSVLKYKKYREDFLQKELEKSPMYQEKMNMLNQDLINGIGKVRQVDIMGKLSDIIEYSAELLEDARDNDVHIKSAQDIRFVSQTMLDAIKLYGETVLAAQRFDKINQDPTLLKPQTINLNVKSALMDILQASIDDGAGYSLVDKLRGGVVVDVDCVDTIET